jgi:hypothetical protein
MKFLCLACGDRKDWKALSKEEQDELLKQDEVLRKRGSLMAAVQKNVVTGVPGMASQTPLTALSNVPLAGSSIIDAASHIRFVSGFFVRHSLSWTTSWHSRLGSITCDGDRKLASKFHLPFRNIGNFRN